MALKIYLRYTTIETAEILRQEGDDYGDNSLAGIDYFLCGIGDRYRWSDIDLAGRRKSGGLICAAFGMGITGQIIVFAAVSFVLLYFTRPWALKYLKPHLVKTNYEEAVGKNVCVTEQIDNVRGTGTAVMNGLEWTARSVDDEKTFEPGMIVMVKEIKGVTLYVTESSDMPQMNGDK